MSAQDNKQTMQQIMTALSKGDRAPFAAAMSDDFVWTIVGAGPWSGSFRGKEVVSKQLIAPLFAQLASYVNQAVRFIAEGDWVVTECRGQGQTKRGEAYDNNYCFVCRFEHGKLVELREYMDTDLAVRALTPPARPATAS